jgi:hypothetical protein
MKANELTKTIVEIKEKGNDGGERVKLVLSKTNSGGRSQ